MRKRTKITIVLLGIIAVLCATVVAQIFYTLTVTNSMRLNLTVGLQLRDSLGTPITAYAWGDFDHLQLKKMASAIGDGVYLLNQGNSAVDVSWNSTCPAGWTFFINNDITGDTWVTGTVLHLALGASQKLQICLVEANAAGSVNYNFKLNFNVVG